MIEYLDSTNDELLASLTRCQGNVAAFAEAHGCERHESDCKTSLHEIGKIVGLSAPSVVERIRKLEEKGVIRGYHAQLERTALAVT